MSLVLLVFTSGAQTNMVKGNLALGVKYGGGLHSFGRFGEVELDWMFKEKMMLRGNLGFEFGSIETTDFKIPSFSLGYVYSMFRIKSIVTFNVVGSGVIGYEFLENNIYRERNINSFLYGGRLGLESDFRLGDKVGLRTEFSEWFLSGGNMGSWFYTGTIGLIFNL